MLKIGERKIAGRISLKSLLIAMAALAATVTTFVCLFGFAFTKQIIVTDAGQSTVYTTGSRTVKEALQEHDIVLGEGDQVSPALDYDLNEGDEIVISRATSIILSKDGVVAQLYSYVDTVGEMLEETGTVMGEYDEVTPARETKLEDGMVVTVDRVTVEVTEKEIEIPFKTNRIPNANEVQGYTKVLQEGKNGRIRQTYKRIVKNGEEVFNDVVGEVVLEETIDRQEEYGTKVENVVMTSRGAQTYRKVLTCSATAYDASPASNGAWAGMTATGRYPQRGIVAVDPNVIPLNSRLYIESSDGGQSWVYGYAIAGDTGGAIKGNKIDLCFDTSAEVWEFGRRTATVYILD